MAGLIREVEAFQAAACDFQVSGCADPNVGPMVQGLYAMVGENHGRPAYRKNELYNGSNVMLYYWDERDGPQFCGWWLAPQIGGDQVWAFSKLLSETPPPGGWRVPISGPIDESLTVRQVPRQPKRVPPPPAPPGISAPPRPAPPAPAAPPPLAPEQTPEPSSARVERADPAGSKAAQERTAAARESGDYAPFPLAVYLTGLGETGSAFCSESMGALVAAASEPYLLVVPQRPKVGWWFINDSGAMGWIRGAFDAKLCRLYASWIEYLAASPGVDQQRISMFGYSAGAYACVELLVELRVPICGVGLGGVHGHGQYDADVGEYQLTAALRQSCRVKWDEFCKRIRAHKGAVHIEATHGLTDKESSWNDALCLLRVLDERQQELGLPRVSVRGLRPEEQDAKPAKKKNRTHHNYWNTAFARRDFYVPFLGGTTTPVVTVDRVEELAIARANRAAANEEGKSLEEWGWTRATPAMAATSSWLSGGSWGQARQEAERSAPARAAHQVPPRPPPRPVPQNDAAQVPVQRPG